MTVIRLQDLFSSPGSSAPSSWMYGVPASAELNLNLVESDTNPASTKGLRLDTVKVCLLANLIATLKSDVPVTITLPEAESLRVQIARTPLLSVLAAHPRVNALPELEPWKDSWAPHDGAQREQMLETGATGTSPNQRYLLTLSSPHQRNSQVVQRDVRGIIDPWLGRRFLSRGRSAQRSAAMRDLETAMSELVENVSDHALVGSRGRRACSIAQLMTTAGGGGASADRFRLTVMDNGIGLPRSIKARRGDLNGIAAVRMALEGRLQYGARGLGLSHVRQIVADHPGSYFLLFTEFLPERNRSIVAKVEGNGEVTVGELDLPLVGTLAIGQVVLPALSSENPTLFEVEDVDLTTATV